MKYLSIAIIALLLTACSNNPANEETPKLIPKDTVSDKVSYIPDTIPGDPNLKINRDTTSLSWLLRNVIITNKFARTFPVQPFRKPIIADDFINGLRGKAGKRGKFTYKFYINSSDGTVYCDLFTDDKIKSKLKLFGYIDDIYMFEGDFHNIIFCDLKKDLILLIEPSVDIYYPEFYKDGNTVYILDNNLVPLVYFYTDQGPQAKVTEVYYSDVSYAGNKIEVKKHSVKIPYLENKNYYSINYSTLMKIQSDIQSKKFEPLNTSEVKEDLFLKRW